MNYCETMHIPGLLISINFEKVKSMWKEFVPRMLTNYMDQISEHQRDLTNSASQRFIPELFAALYISLKKLTKTMSKLSVDQNNVTKNFQQNSNTPFPRHTHI